jgi:hypothetical protein
MGDWLAMRWPRRVGSVARSGELLIADERGDLGAVAAGAPDGLPCVRTRPIGRVTRELRCRNDVADQGRRTG